MDATSMHVMLDIKDALKAQGKWNNLADIMHKDSSTVAKQFDAKTGTQTLQIAYSYAEEANGRIVFMTDAEWERLQAIEKALVDHEHQINRLIAEAEALNKQITNLTDTNNSLTVQRENQQKIILKLEVNIEKKEAKIDEKDAIIVNKDAIIVNKDKIIHNLLAEKDAIHD